MKPVVGLATIAAGILVALAATGKAPGRPAPDAHRLARRVANAAAIDSLERLGRLGDAIALARSELHARETEGADRPTLVRARVRLGELLTRQGETRTAIEVLDRAVEMAGDRISPLERGAILLARGRAAKNTSLYARSEADYEEAIRLARTAGDEGLALHARVLVSTGHLIRRDVAQRPRAVQLFEEALALFDRAPGTTPEDVVAAQSGLALVLLQMGEAARAESLLTHSVPATIASLGDAHADVGLAHSLWGWSQYLLGRYPESETSFRAAMATYDRARDHFGAPANRRRVMQRVAANLAAAILEQGRTEEAWEVLEVGLSSYLMDRLAPQSPASASPPRVARASLQSAMGPGTAMVGWLDVNLVNENPRRVWAFVIRDTGPVRWVRLPAPASLYSGGAGVLMNAIQRDVAWPARVMPQAATREAQRLAWAERFAPLEPLLAGVDRLIVMNIWLGGAIPLEALEDSDGRVLLDRFEITYAPSARAWLMLRERAIAHRHVAAPRALLVGEPGTRGAATGALRQLPGTGRELAELERHWPGATLVTREPARTVRRLAASGALGGYDLLHFATHATTSPRAPGGGALLFGAGLEKADSAVMLSAAEIENFRLDARLVTLSGCETSGLQGFGSAEGLGESFLVAGAAGVVVSLWSIEDRAAELLMARFHENLAGRSGSSDRGIDDPAAALREAKQWLRDLPDEHGRRSFANPAYWSGFVFIGARAEDEPAL